MFKSLFRLPTKLIFAVRLHFVARRVLKRLKAQNGQVTDVDVGYAMAPELIRLFGSDRVHKGLAFKMASGQITGNDIGIARWIVQNHRVEL